MEAGPSLRTTAYLLFLVHLLLTIRHGGRLHLAPSLQPPIITLAVPQKLGTVQGRRQLEGHWHGPLPLSILLVLPQYMVRHADPVRQVGSAVVAAARGGSMHNSGQLGQCLGPLASPG